ncbi:MAG: hypothetical protein ACRD7E_29150, partial [Bryobacteraceae bacterium]
FIVGADLALLRKYHIAVQEVPLLCRRLLEGLGDGPEPQSLMFTEEDMAGYANKRTAARDAAAQKKKIVHRSPHRLGAAWRPPGQATPPGHSTE